MTCSLMVDFTAQTDDWYHTAGQLSIINQLEECSVPSTLRRRPSTGAGSRLLSGPWSVVRCAASCSGCAGTLTCSSGEI